MTSQNNWRIVSNAICYNINATCMSKFDETLDIDDLIYPCMCGLYLAINWDMIYFSKEDKLNNYKSHVSGNVNYLTQHLLENQPISKELIQTDIDAGYMGSYVFVSHIIHIMKLAYNKQIQTMNPKDFFQDTWEVIFWFVQGSKSREQKLFINLISDFGDHEKSFDKTLVLINTING